ncbi:MAG: hypothetical protein ACK46X_18800, partial [Candidatus Sericytochromatia bacterium]
SLAAQRASEPNRRLMAFPDATPAWAGGLALSAYGCAPTDTVPNGPAVAYPALGPMVNKLLFLTAAGTLIRLDRLNPSDAATLALGRAVSRSAVSLSPYSTRAYVATDDGTFHVIDAVTMTVLATRRVAGAHGIAPVVDRLASFPDDSRDVVYLPANDGHVRRMVVRPDGAGGVAIEDEADFAVAVDAPAAADGRRVGASAMVVNGVIHLGDLAGRFHVYDTRDAHRRMTYALGGPVTTAPALELQDGSYAMTDPYGTPKEVGYGEAVYAFVSAGSACVWINLHDATATPSMPLRIDDNQASKTYGYLRDYAFSTAGTTETLEAVDGGNLNTERPDRALPGYGAVRSNDYLVPAETNTYEEAGEARGGEVKSFVRWASTKAHPSGAIVTQATLTLTAANDQACPPPLAKASSPYARGGLTPWVSGALTNEAAPAIGPAVSRFLGGGVLANGNVVFKKNKAYTWDVSPAFSSPSGAYALALEHDAGGDSVLWPQGPVGGAVGKKAKKATQVEAVKFDTRATLTLRVGATRLATGTIETPPMIDPVRKKAYVFHTNALFELDFSSPEAFSDADPASAPRTLFALAHQGRASTGGGATYDSRRLFVGNMTAPLLSHNASAAYVLSRYPAAGGAAPTAWNYGLSKFSLPLSASVDPLSPGAPTHPAISREASHMMLIEPRTKLARGAGNLYYGLGDGRLYQAEQ